MLQDRWPQCCPITVSHQGIVDRSIAIVLGSNLVEVLSQEAVDLPVDWWWSVQPHLQCHVGVLPILGPLFPIGELKQVVQLG